ncbi:hypothetical protein GCM10009831_31780 [Dietzia cercidiphylli]|uniref:Uncharacterized protein n=1 Tax=Dietzia cercidiphylli TaxID=498199 RepID=A0ABN2J791_9ACTN
MGEVTPFLASISQVPSQLSSFVISHSRHRSTFATINGASGLSVGLMVPACQVKRPECVLYASRPPGQVPR